MSQAVDVFVAKLCVGKDFSKRCNNNSELLLGVSKRRGYKRFSRCLLCQNRRVKCQDEKPRCSYCLCRNFTCRIYTRPRSSTTGIKMIAPKVDSKSTTTQPMNRVKKTSTPPSEAKEKNVEDLKLMMHWYTTTYRSLARSSAVENIWQSIVPREAVKHPYLMHGVLALSALHLSSENEERREDYLRTAQYHQTHALAGLERIARGGVNQLNSDAAFALSNIMIAFSFARTLLGGHAISQKSAVDDLCDIFQSARRSAHLPTETTELTLAGELSPLIKRTTSSPTMPNTSILAIMSLQRTNTILASQHPTHETETYSTTIQHLSSCLKTLSEGGGEISSIAFSWILQIPPRFLDLLRDRRPFALVILAHYAVALHSLRGYWWMGDVGERVLCEIGSCLNAEWKQSIEWAIDATGVRLP